MPSASKIYFYIFLFFLSTSGGVSDFPLKYVEQENFIPQCFKKSIHLQKIEILKILTYVMACKLSAPELKSLPFEIRFTVEKNV